MTEESGHNEDKKIDYEDFFEDFPDEEREKIKKIWVTSRRASPSKPDITEEETEQALSEVHGRLEKMSPADTRSSSTGLRWKWMAAAAVILLVFGAGILFTPKTVEAPYGEIITVELPDATTVELNSGSRLQYNRLFAYFNRTVYLNGEAFFSVVDGDYPFIVNTNSSIVEVTGTQFNVRSWSGDPGKETEVTVSEGEVHFYPLDSPDNAVIINPGYLSKWMSSMEKPTPPKPVVIDRVLGWRNHMLIFNDRPLSVIIRELERRFNVDIALENQNVANETLTTYYAEPENVESVLEDICRVKGLRYSETANGFRIYK